MTLRHYFTFKNKDFKAFHNAILSEMNSHEHAVILTGSSVSDSSNKLLAGLGVESEIQPNESAFDSLKQFRSTINDWAFGYLSYDLKEEIHHVSSAKHATIPFPKLHFFQPRIQILADDNEITIGLLGKDVSQGDAEKVLQRILSHSPVLSGAQTELRVTPSIRKEEYLHSVRSLQNHIQRGDIYEINFCQEFTARSETLNPFVLFNNVLEYTGSPYSALVKSGERFAVCGSPERFLKKSGNRILSQPMKGTIRRGETKEEDQAARQSLASDPKENSENAMIVDLVRNDLSRSCNNVHTNDLFEIYTFKHWHQMVSTVCGDLKPGLSAVDVIKGSFPMGSMTGAPKRRALELIDEYEFAGRGLFSGAIGYFTPDDDLDLNVVIRSIFYDRSSGTISLSAGSAITAASDPEREYKECLLKIQPLLQALNGELAHEVDELLESAS